MINKFKIRKTAFASLLVAILSLAIGTVVWAWSDPNTNMPVYNPLSTETGKGVPLSASSEEQTKLGHLTVGGLVSNKNVNIGLIGNGDLNILQGSAIISGDLSVDTNTLKVLSGSDWVGIGKPPNRNRLDVQGEAYLKAVNTNALAIDSDNRTGLSVLGNSTNHFALLAESTGQTGGCGIRALGGDAVIAPDSATIALSSSTDCDTSWAGYFYGRLKIEIGFKPGNSDINPRAYQTATLLSDGNVLIAGGLSNDGNNLTISGTVSLFNPTDNSFAPYKEDLFFPRFHHTADLISGDKVVIAGGFINFDLEATNTTQVLNGKTPFLLNTARANHASVVINKGSNIVYIGGEDYINGQHLALNSIEICNSGVCETKNHLITARANHTATLLADGRILIAGGQSSGGNYLNTTEIYNPADDTIVQGPTFTGPRANHTATLLNNGKVLMAGGYSANSPNFLWGTHYDSTVIYTPNELTGSFANGPTLLAARSQHSATLLPDGKVMLLGGEDSRKEIIQAPNEIYDPNQNAVTEGPPFIYSGRMGHTTTFLDDERILVVGGQFDFAEGSVIDQGSEYFASGIFTSLAAEEQELDKSYTKRIDHTATPLSDGKVLLAGGRQSPYGWLNDLVVFDPSVPIDQAFAEVAGNLAQAVSHQTATPASLSASWWDGEYDYRERIKVTNQSATETLSDSYVVTLSPDPNIIADWVAAGHLSEDKKDWRIVYFNAASGQWQEIDRHIVFHNTEKTSMDVFFRLQKPIAAGVGQADSSYFVYYGNQNLVDEPKADKSQIYNIWEDFSGGPLEGNWSIDLSANLGDLNIASMTTGITGPLTLSHGPDINNLKINSGTITVSVTDGVNPVPNATVTFSCTKETAGDCSGDRDRHGVFWNGNTALTNESGVATIIFSAPIADNELFILPYGYNILGDYDITATASHSNYNSSLPLTMDDFISTSQPIIDSFNLTGFLCRSTCRDNCNNDAYYCAGTVVLQAEGMSVNNVSITPLSPPSCTSRWTGTCNKPSGWSCSISPSSSLSHGVSFRVNTNRATALGPDCWFGMAVSKTNYQSASLSKKPSWYQTLCPGGPGCDIGEIEPLVFNDNLERWVGASRSVIKSFWTVDQAFAREFLLPIDNQKKVALGQVAGETEEDVPGIYISAEQLKIDALPGTYAHIQRPRDGDLVPENNVIFEGKLKTPDGNTEENDWGNSLALYWDNNNWVQIRQKTEGSSNQWVIRQLDNGTPDEKTEDGIQWHFNLDQYYCLRLSLGTDPADLSKIQYQVAPTTYTSESCDRINLAWTTLATLTRPESGKPSKIMVGKGSGTINDDLDNNSPTPGSEIKSYYADDILLKGVVDTPPTVELMIGSSSVDEAVILIGGQGISSTSPAISDKIYFYYPDYTGSTGGQIAERLTNFPDNGLPDGPRTHHTATLLSDGRILIAGGYNSLNSTAEALNTTLIYNPYDDTFSDGPQIIRRANHTAIALSGNRVLLVGGNSQVEDNSLNSAEIVDVNPGGTPVFIPDIGGARSYQTATQLPNGDVLIAGGKNLDKNQVHGGNVLDTTVIYHNDATHTFISGPALSSPRFNHTATLTVDSNFVIIIGGESNDNYPVSQTDIYQVLSNDISNDHPVMTDPRTGHAATLMVDGKIYVFGGRQVWGTILNTSNLYEQATMVVNSDKMVKNLNADMLDGYHAENFVLTGEVGEEYIQNQTPATWQAQSGSIRLSDLSQVNDTAITNPAGVEAVSTAATQPAVTATQTATEGSALYAYSTASSGQTTSSLYAEAGSGTLGTRYAAYFGGAVYLGGSTPLTVDSTAPVSNLNADLLDGLSISDFVLKQDLTQYVKFNTAEWQTGNIHLSGAANFSEVVTSNVNTTDPALSAANGGIEATGGTYALHVYGGTSSGTNWAGYFVGNVGVTGNLNIENGKLMFEGADSAAGSGQISQGSNCSANICRSYIDGNSKIIVNVTDFGVDADEYNVRVDRSGTCFQVCTFNDATDPAVSFDYLIVQSL